MTIATFTCPRCLYSAVRAEAIRFCPRCGLEDQVPPAADGPILVAFEGKIVNVWDAIAQGDVANLYRWTIQNQPGVGVFKVARTHMANRHVMHESQVLRQLHKADSQYRFAPFLPRSVGTVVYRSTANEPARSASILIYHPDIAGPDELYSLEEVRQRHAAGIDARDMAWMWRRLLTILAFVHEQGIVHGCVTPDHVLIEPREHKLVLIGWCGAVHRGNEPILAPTRWRNWCDWSHGATPDTDLSAAARTMQSLLKPDTESAIARHLERACGANVGGAGKLLDDFDKLIEALWGPRQFRPFAMIRTRPLGKEMQNG